MTKVSVIITNYNYGRYLDRAIRSVLTQDFAHNLFEVIVVDDASIDESVDIIKSYKRTIRPVLLPKNSGLSYARNKGVEAAKGEYVVFMDADDYVNRDLIRTQSIFLDWNKEWDAVSVDYLVVADDETILGRSSGSDEPIACGIMYRREQLVENGPFDEELRMHEEKDFRLRFLRKHNIHNIELPLYRYRRHGRNMTEDAASSSFYMECLKRKHVEAEEETIAA